MGKQIFCKEYAKLGAKRAPESAALHGARSFPARNLQRRAGWDSG